MSEPKLWRDNSKTTPENKKDDDKESIPATRFLDGLSYIGNDEAGCFVLETTEGIVIFDAINDTERYLDLIKEGFDELDIDVMDTKIILLMHASEESLRRAASLRKLTKARILMANADYDFLKWKNTIPRPDEYVEDEEVIRIGDYEIRCFIMSTNPSGTLSFVFNVYDNGKRHMASLWSGSREAESVEDCDQQVKEAIRFSLTNDKYDVDVVLHEHLFEINGKEKLQIVRNVFSDGVSNPFVIGREACQQFEKHLISKAISYREKMLNA